MHQPAPAVFDPDVLGAMFGSETAVIASVLQTFLAGARGNLAELAQAADPPDLAAVAKLAHKITGACRMSGALAMGQTARDLEQAAKEGHAAAVPTLFAELQSQWRLLEAALGDVTASGL